MSNPQARGRARGRQAPNGHAPGGGAGAHVATPPPNAWGPPRPSNGSSNRGAARPNPPSAAAGPAPAAGGGPLGAGASGRRYLDDLFARMTVNEGPDAERPRAIRGGKESLKELAELVRPKCIENKKQPAGLQKFEKALTVYANAYPIADAAQFTLFQYVFYFEPQQDSKGARLRLVNSTMKAQHFKGSLSFDGMNGWSSVRLPNEETTVVGESREGKVTIRCRLTCELPRESPTTRQMLNVVLRDAQTALGQVQIRRNFYSSNLETRVPEHRVAVWPGFSTRIDDYDGGRFLVLDVSHTVLRMETVLEQMNAWGNRNTIIRELVGQSVLARYSNRHYKVDDVDFDQNALSKFSGRDGPISYAEYFKSKYSMKDIPSQQPLLIHRLKGSERRAAEQQGRPTEIHLLPSLCYMTGITENMRRDYRFMNALAQYTKPSPSTRVEQYEKFTKSLSLPEASAKVNPWGLRLENSLVKIQAKRIEPERIYFEGNNQFSCDDPVRAIDWSGAMKGKRLNKSLLIRIKWICPRDIVQRAKPFVELLRNCLATLGGRDNLQDGGLVQVDGRPQGYVDACNQIEADGGANAYSIVIVFLKGDSCYAVTKRKLTAHLGIPSQMIKFDERKLSPPKGMSIANKIAIQIFSKCGGIPWVVDIPPNKDEVKLMVVGIDVFHKRDSPSVLAFVASLNGSLTKMHSSTSRQDTSFDEVGGGEIKVMMVEALKAFYAENKKLPKDIFVYRDGVSEGQLKALVDTEVKSLLSAITTISAENKPNLTVTVVTKRIPQRFMVESNSKFANPPPGTVVDKSVTRSEYQDFFHISQTTREGTVSPTHYNVVHDESKYNLGVQQRLVSKLCCLYFNWQGTIKVPAPCQYAHKLAAQVGESLGGDMPAKNLSQRLHFL